MDERTIDSARRGDRQAQASLLRAMQDSWFRLGLTLLGDGERAREAAQETGLRFLRQLPSFRGESQLRTWSIGIALNVIREMRRDRRPPPQTEMPAAESPDEAAEAAEQHQLLRTILADLPDRQREAVTLRFFEELSIQQTAKIMGCAPGTVKATIHQALRTLRRKLKQLT